jgi:hypothetical protein
MQQGYRGGKKQPEYEDFEASELFCARCKTAVPVFKKLLLVLPQGEKYLYLCSRCGAEVGEKTVTSAENADVIIA